MSENRESALPASGRVFVGRQTELAALGAALERAMAGRGGVWLVAGEPGIGKSELADRLAAVATARGAEVLWGRSWEGEGAPPYWPWAQIVRAYVQERGAVEVEAIFGAATAYVAQIVPEFRERLPDLPVPSTLDSEQARFRLFDAVTTFLTSAAGARPLVLVLDDLHWADKPTLLLLRFLAREVVTARLLVFAAYRDVEVSPGHPLAEVLPSLRQERTVERILLRGLPEDEVHTMLAALRGETVSEALARAISRETEGNPFFVQEIFRHLADEGVLGRGTLWTGRSRIEDVRLPESVRDVIGRRLARLSAECTKVLIAASVVGREFGVDVLGRVTEVEEERLLEVLEEAVAARVVEEAPQAIGRYRFSHALVRETLYGNLRTLDRVRRHHRVAQVLETLYARNREPRLAELAHHFLEALPGGDVDKAVGYATRAGDRANEQLAFEEAALHYERALQALELGEQPNQRLRCELLLKHGEAGWSAGFQATASLEEAADLAERLGDAEILARAALGRAGFGTGLHVMPGEPVQMALLQRALGALPDSDSALRAQVMGRLSALRIFMGDARDNPAFARSAVAMARRVGDKTALSHVLNTTMWAACGPDDHAEALDRTAELIRLGEEIGDARLAAEAHVWQGRHHVEIGDIASADRELELQERFASSSGQAYHRWLAELTRGALAFVEGRFDEAEAFLSSALQLGREGGATFVNAARGSFILLNEQKGLQSDQLPLYVSLAAQYPIFIWRAAVARMTFLAGRVEEARRHFETLAANDLVDVPRDMTWLFNMSRFAELAVMLGDARRAALVYDLLLPYGDRCIVLGGSFASRGSVWRTLGGIAALLARYDEAERHFERALAVNARIRARIYVAHTQYEYARMLIARGGPGDREKATALAAQALATAREVGMKPLEANVLELRTAAGLGDEPTPTPVTEAGRTLATSAVFRREGDFWTIAYEGKRIRLRDAKGLQYIAYLLRDDGREIHAADLAAGVDGATMPGAAQRGVDAIAAGLRDAGETLDASARAAYRQRLQDLEAELAEATEWADAGRTAKLQAEIEFVRDELSGSYGLGGRARKAADVGDRARKAVTSRIRESIDRIGKEHPALARHFENAIHTGTFCGYQPDRAIRWEL